MKFTVVNEKGKPVELTLTYCGGGTTAADDRYRSITVCVLWCDMKLLGTGVAIKHPHDDFCDDGERLSFKRALQVTEFSWFYKNHLTPRMVVKAWKKERGEEGKRNANSDRPA